jgi:hypothetical protein
MPHIARRPLHPLTITFLVALVLFPLYALGQSVNDRVLLVERALRVPGHPSAGSNAISHRFPGSTTVTVTAIDAATGWFNVKDDAGNAAWITRTYIASVVPATPPTPSGQCYEVVLWNLEHFGKNKTDAAADTVGRIRSNSPARHPVEHREAGGSYDGTRGLATSRTIFKAIKSREGQSTACLPEDQRSACPAATQESKPDRQPRLVYHLLCPAHTQITCPAPTHRFRVCSGGCRH